MTEQSLRQILKFAWTDDKECYLAKCRMSELKEGDLFIIADEAGYWRAVSEPYLRDDMVWAITAETAELTEEQIRALGSKR